MTHVHLIVPSTLSIPQTHGSEIPNMYQAGDMSDLFIHFVNTFNPNPPSGIGHNKTRLHWPRYSNTEPTMLVFNGNDTFAFKEDTYRPEQITFINELNIKV